MLRDVRFSRTYNIIPDCMYHAHTIIPPEGKKKDNCLDDGMYDRKYIARRGPSISLINSSIAFRLCPITIYLRERVMTPPTDPEKRKRNVSVSNREERKVRWRRKRGERNSPSRESSGSRVRASVCEKVSGSRCLRARRDENLASVFITRKIPATPTLRWPQINQWRGRGLCRRSVACEQL